MVDIRHRPFRKHHRRHPHPVPPPSPSGQVPPVWPSYTGESQFVGKTSDGITVWVDPTLQSAGLDNASALLADADRIVDINDTIFGLTLPLPAPVNVIVFAIGGATDGTGGADHMACGFSQGGNIEVCASFGANDRVSSLFMAELSECAMGGNLCGLSTGEALSRWCAMVVANNALGDFASAPSWWAAGMPDYVTKIDPTDQDQLSIGCGMAFISWLLSEGASLMTIAKAMVKLGDAGTFAALYEEVGLGKATDAWGNFMSALNGKVVSSDDPFNAINKALPVPPPLGV